MVSFNPTTLSETIQRIISGEATLSFDDNEHINVANDNGMTTTVQRMDERLDRLEDIQKSCQLSRTAFPVETNQHLPAQSDCQNVLRQITFQLVVLINLSTVFHETVSTFLQNKSMEWEPIHSKLELSVVNFN